MGYRSTVLLAGQRDLADFTEFVPGTTRRLAAFRDPLNSIAALQRLSLNRRRGQV